MNKAKELKQTTKIVREIMENDERARNSDDYLILAVCTSINPECADLPFSEVMKHRKELGLPVFETIRRTGQRIREKHPELCGNEVVEAVRQLNQEVFRDYAKGIL